MAATSDANAETPVEKLNLTYISGSAAVWNTTDWKRLLHSRIVGRFVGNLAQQCHQVKDAGFPLLLSRNETTLLLEKNLATLSYPDHLAAEPSTDTKLKYDEFRQNSFQRQVELLKEQRKREILEKADEIVNGKLNCKRPRLSKSPETIIQEEISKIADPSPAYLLIQIPTEDISTIKWKPINWTYPETEEEKFEYATFRALHEKGYWITSGAKFGGHFLVYAGSPLQYHAKYIIRCEDKLKPFQLAAFARVAHSTRKIPVIAYKRRNEIAFQSITWLSN